MYQLQKNIMDVSLMNTYVKNVEKEQIGYTNNSSFSLNLKKIYLIIFLS